MTMGVCAESVWDTFERHQSSRPEGPRDTPCQTPAETPQTPSHGHKLPQNLVAHDCGYPLSRYTCRATRVAAGFYSVLQV